MRYKKKTITFLKSASKILLGALIAISLNSAVYQCYYNTAFTSSASEKA